MAFTRIIRPIAPVGSMRNNRNASAGRDINKPQASAPTVPAPRALNNIFIVRLRGKAPSDEPPSGPSSAGTLGGGSSSRRISARDAASRAKVSSLAERISTDHSSSGERM
jgi:hypothetical protein